MTKVAVIIGGVLLLAGAALAGTLSSLGSSKTPTIGRSFAPASSTRQDDAVRERELRGRENEAGEDMRGPCDEAEHANDPRCAGATAPRADDDQNEAEERANDRGRDDSSNSGPSEHSGRSGGEDGGHSGRGGGDD